MFNRIDTEQLLFILTVFPFLAAICLYWVRSRRLRSSILAVSCLLLVSSALLLIGRTPFRLGPCRIAGLDARTLAEVGDFLVLGVILYFGFKHSHPLVKILAALQIVLLGFLTARSQSAPISFRGDNLSLIMVLIVSVVGSVICLQAIAYMQAHEEHLKLERSGAHRFFSVMLLFLGAMNGVVLANDMGFFYFFFEITTLCSFLLIKHDDTPISIENGLRALWMNSLGGLFVLSAMIAMSFGPSGLDMERMIARGSPGGICLAFLCLAAFTKSAQFPFQRWLLGAMVAPTPVSALLHSSTMVKIGVYLVLRIAPAMRGTFLSEIVTVFGAFTFLAAAALAVGQSNGKKVLAYSTISNLGLIFACAGLNTAEALTAAVMLIIFHAVVKALLFLCVGAIEQRIESRDIEDMRGLYSRMPITALITVLGVVMVIMPPFGLLLGKWMAIESAAGNLQAIVMAATGSALTVMYWARWAGTLMSDPFAGRFTPERQPLLTWGALGVLSAGGCILSAAAPWLYGKLFPGIIGAVHGALYSAHAGVLENGRGMFPVVPLVVVAAAGFAVSILALLRASRARIVKPYLSGLQTDAPGLFTGPMNRPVKAEAGNYYLSSLFGEKRLTAWINFAALSLLGLLLGSAL